MTCGTADKRAFLLEAFPALREDHIGDSRSTSFEALVKSRTNGAGVHLALNSLADDKLQVQSVLHTILSRACVQPCLPPAQQDRVMLDHQRGTAA